MAIGFWFFCLAMSVCSAEDPPAGPLGDVTPRELLRMPKSPWGDVRVLQVDKGRSWVSPFWGYSTPKIVLEGPRAYTVGLWGEDPDSAEGCVYVLESGAWTRGARLEGIYQPPTVSVLPDGRLLVVHTRKEKPVRILRSRKAGQVLAIEDFEELPAPPDMKTAYYIGIAAKDQTLYLAYLTSPDYSMFVSRLDLSSNAWSPSILLSQGQVTQKPKTSWTYPILVPNREGLHVVASNSPDGGEGNTYDQVWHVELDKAAEKILAQEKVADTPMGRVSYAMDAACDDAGGLHILFLWNQRVYGDPAPEGSPEEGLYHAWKTSRSDPWQMERLGPLGYGSFWISPQGTVFGLFIQADGLKGLAWKGPGKGWQEVPELCAASSLPVRPGFMDVISRSSGSLPSAGPIVVGDGLLPSQDDKTSERILWSLQASSSPRKGSP